MIFPSEDEHPRKVIHPLVRPQPQQSVRPLCDIAPINVKFFKAGLLETRRRLLIFNKLHFVFVFANISDDIILAVAHINYKFLLLVLVFLSSGPSALIIRNTPIDVQHQTASSWVRQLLLCFPTFWYTCGLLLLVLTLVWFFTWLFHLISRSLLRKQPSIVCRLRHRYGLRCTLMLVDLHCIKCLPLIINVAHWL